MEDLFDSITNSTRKKTIKDIEDIISKLYTIGDKEHMRVVRKLTGFGTVAGDWDIMHSSGNNSDCLIHSFLNCTCESFRRLEQEDKNEFANFFRRIILPSLQTFQCYQNNSEQRERREQLDRINKHAFLEDTELYILAGEFQVSLLLASTNTARKEKYKLQPLTPSDDSLGLFLPGCITPGNWPFICIYNNGAHYEGVRINNSYMTTQTKVDSARDAFVLAHPRNDPELAAALKESEAAEKPASASAKKPASVEKPASAKKTETAEKPATAESPSKPSSATAKRCAACGMKSFGSACEFCGAAFPEKLSPLKLSPQKLTLRNNSPHTARAKHFNATVKKVKSWLHEAVLGRKPSPGNVGTRKILGQLYNRILAKNENGKTRFHRWGQALRKFFTRNQRT